MKNCMKRLIVWLLVACMLTPCAALAVGTLEISSVTGKAGENVVVEVRLKSDDVYGGNFTLCYDTQQLRLVSAEQAQGYMAAINPSYGPGQVRVSLFSSNQPIRDAVLCTLTFCILADTPVEGTAITATGVRLYGEDNLPVSHSVITGTVTRDCAWLRLDSTDTVEGQAARVEVSLSGGVKPAGGNFTITYDPKVVRPTAVLKLPAAGNAYLDYSLAESGKVKVAFGGAAGITAGKLCAVIFSAVGAADSGTQLKLSDIRLYDENSQTVDHAVTGGAVNIVVPTEADPKLWVVGGAMEADGSATASVVLQGRGKVCGGQFTLRYNRAMTAAVSAASGVEIREDEGQITASWAGETPSLSGQTLLTVTFTDAVEGSKLTFDGNVRLYDENSQSVSVVDIRPATVTAAAGVTTTVDEVKTETAGSATRVTASIDLADANFHSETPTQAVSLMLALYKDGRMTGVAMAEEVALDGGTAETSLSAQTSMGYDAYQVFVLGSVNGEARPMQPVSPSKKGEKDKLPEPEAPVPQAQTIEYAIFAGVGETTYLGHHEVRLFTADNVYVDYTVTSVDGITKPESMSAALDALPVNSLVRCSVNGSAISLYTPDYSSADLTDVRGSVTYDKDAQAWCVDDKSYAWSDGVVFVSDGTPADLAGYPDMLVWTACRKGDDVPGDEAAFELTGHIYLDGTGIAAGAVMPNGSKEAYGIVTCWSEGVLGLKTVHLYTAENTYETYYVTSVNGEKIYNQIINYEEMFPVNTLVRYCVDGNTAELCSWDDETSGTAVSADVTYSVADDAWIAADGTEYSWNHGVIFATVGEDNSMTAASGDWVWRAYRHGEFQPETPNWLSDGTADSIVTGISGSRIVAAAVIGDANQTLPGLVLGDNEEWLTLTKDPVLMYSAVEDGTGTYTYTLTTLVPGYPNGTQTRTLTSSVPLSNAMTRGNIYRATFDESGNLVYWTEVENASGLGTNGIELACVQITGVRIAGGKT